MTQRHKITAFYAAPTAIRSLMRFGNETPQEYDWSVGELINPEAWRCHYKVIGDEQCAIIDTCWQTKTGGHVTYNLPGVVPMKPGSYAFLFYGIYLAVLDPQTGKKIEVNDVEIIVAIKNHGQSWQEVFFMIIIHFSISMWSHAQDIISQEMDIFATKMDTLTWLDAHMTQLMFLVIALGQLKFNPP